MAKITNDKFQKMNLSICDLFGKTIYNENFNPTNSRFSKTFDISSHSKGIYMLRIEVNDNIHHSKIIYQ